MDDEINRQSGIDFDNNFETYKVKESGFCKNIMHTKFCIIDLNTVLHGSYNWTKKAQYNKEEITVDKSRELAEIYANGFIQLKIDKKRK